MAKAVAPTPGSKYRIKVGQTIAGLCWSNAATTIQGFWTIVYDDGDPDYWPIVQSASGSSRAAVNWSTGQVAKKNGWVVGGLVGGGGSFQRGQLYHQAFVVDTNLSVVSDVIACGYAYAGHVVEFGTFVEPGPAGGHGQTVTLSLGTPAVGVNYADFTLAAGQGVKLRGFNGQLVTGVGVANREHTIRILADGTNLGAGGVASEIQTASLTLDYFGSNPGISSGVSASLGGGAISVGIPDFFIPPGGKIRNATENIQAADQWGVGTIIFEEWVMPN